MKVLLLSGGSGQNLWPLSNDVRSKQFIKLFQHEDNEESLLQRIYRQLHHCDNDAFCAIATSKPQVSTIQNQLGHDVVLSVEPSRKDTFAAIALACEYLQYNDLADKDETILVCPVDLYVEDTFFETVFALDTIIQDHRAKLCLIGIEPQGYSTKYGYIERDDQDTFKAFHSRVGENIAKSLVEEGALWNSGIYAFRLGYLLEKAKDYLHYQDYIDLYKHYNNIKPISFDDAIVSKEESIQVIPYEGNWLDIGSWDAFSTIMEENVIGKGIVGDSCTNVQIVNELNIPIVALGLNDSVISASSQGILVTSKKDSENIKPYVDQMNPQVMYAEKSWGAFHIIDVNENSLTIKVTMKAGEHMNYHSHERRDEVWTIVRGEGKTIVEGMEQHVHPGDVITMDAGCKHTIIALTDLDIIEVQLGKDISINDKEVFPYIFE